MKKISMEIRAAFICGVVVLLAALFETLFNDFAFAAIAAAIKDVAGTGAVFVVYFAAVKSLREGTRKNHDKLRHLDELEKAKHEISKSADISPYYKTIFYGMQVSIYNGELENLLKKVTEALEKPHFGKECKAALLCVRDVLYFFKETEYFSKGLSDKRYEECMNWLSPDNEEWLKISASIKDKDLAAWCEFQRADVMELVMENRIKQVGLDEELLENALDKCFELITLLNQQVESNSEDKYYALLYRSYVNRNISCLYRVKGDEENCGKFSAETLKNRKELFEHYEEDGGYGDVMEDHIGHEYLLAMVEHCSVEKDAAKKKELKETSLMLHKRWRDKIGLQQMIFKRVEEEIKKIS